MKEKINGLLDAVKALRSEAFAARNEELHTHLGRAFSSLLRAKENLEGRS